MLITLYFENGSSNTLLKEKDVAKDILPNVFIFAIVFTACGCTSCSILVNILKKMIFRSTGKVFQVVGAGQVL